ncbi:MAG TPA: methylmalonyl Co-A mutase-associated GTPase MeaB [Acidimicrobiia bacterium]|nr:methylmalonyl Co-A mutase-associated GTPase MeaB [Acidimicrobiia bacterium]
MPLPTDPASLAAAVAAGDRRALARAISIVEDHRPGAPEIVAAVYSGAVHGHRVGITGAPGAGKSTLTDRLIAVVRRSGEEVAVLAIDPSSPFSGGAVLGDRVRMQDHVDDPGVFVRSMASRGHLGGLSAAAPKALAVLDAAGFPWLVVETVGVGQDEVEIAGAADTTVVVLNPGWGDGIQAAKAGILEIGDVFVVNKSDRTGADDTVNDLHTMLTMGPQRPWTPPIVKTVAATGEGVDELVDALGRHRAHLAEGGRIEAHRRERRRADLVGALAAELERRARALVAEAAETAAVDDGTLDPWTAAARIAARTSDG